MLRTRPARRLHAARLLAVVLAALLLVAACGDDDGESISQATAPPTPEARSYTVVSGDTLDGIAARLGVSVAELVVANEISDPNLIDVGQVLLLPRDEPVTTAGSPPTPLTCAEHRTLVEDAAAAAELIGQASTRGAGTQYTPFLEEIDRVSGLLVRRSEAARAELDTLLRVLAKLAIDATRLGLGQVTAADAAVAETAAELRAASDRLLDDVCANASAPEPSRPSPNAAEFPVHPSRETGVA